MENNTKKVNCWRLGALTILTSIFFIISSCSSNQMNDPQSTNSKEVYTVVEDFPQYPGGTEALFKYLESEIKYPKEAIEKGIEGQVLVQFDIERNGSITAVVAVKGVGAGCEDEAIRALKSALAFKPGMQRGKTVKVRRVIPINFELSTKNNIEQGNVIIKEMNNVNFILKADANYSNGVWTGTLYDAETGSVLPGANIVVPGTTVGTVSNTEGAFKVKATDSKDLVISFVGYQTLKLEGK